MSPRNKFGLLGGGFAAAMFALAAFFHTRSDRGDDLTFWLNVLCSAGWASWFVHTARRHHRELREQKLAESGAHS